MDRFSSSSPTQVILGYLLVEKGLQPISKSFNNSSACLALEFLFSGETVSEIVGAGGLILSSREPSSGPDAVMECADLVSRDLRS